MASYTLLKENERFQLIFDSTEEIYKIIRKVDNRMREEWGSRERIEKIWERYSD
jgi:hypothetical protein